MYADYLVLISLSSAGLSQLLNECEKFGTRHDVKYNAQKSAVMIYRSMTLEGITKNLPLLNYKLLIITFFKCFLACPNMKAPDTYAHFLTCNAANL